ncbi:MAG: DNA-3-methyladenine glycosylase [Desulfurococcales archaeon]|nr:DNA-3-methyladenine glycosylase [Desulfurococcales archaeon]
MIKGLVERECHGSRYPKEFYARRPDIVARDLLGSLIVAGSRTCIIIETEAYFGDCDPGSRASKYKGGRIRERFYGEPGRFLIYGMHGWLLTNIVSHEPGRGGAVLLRSCYSPVDGVVEGPGKLSRYLGVAMEYDGAIVGGNSSPGVRCGYRARSPVRLYRVNVRVDFDEPFRYADGGFFRPRRYRPEKTVGFTYC